MISKGKQSYFQAIRRISSSVTLSAPAKDWLVLQRACPDLISLVNDRGITIIPSLFSHALPTLFPESLPSQLWYGSQAISDLFERVWRVGIIPENDVSSLVAESCLQHWQGIFHSVSHFRSARQTRINRMPGYWRLRAASAHDSSIFIPLLIISNDSAREAYLNAFRESEEVSVVIQALRVRDDIPESAAFLSDFERPWSNCVRFSAKEASPPRMDVWSLFHKHISKEAMISLDFLDQFEQSAAASPFIDLPSQSMTMWRCAASRWLCDLQQEIMSQNVGAGDYFELASLVVCSCMPPRVLCRMLDKDEFPATCKGRIGRVDFIGDVAKVHELLLICRNIQNRRSISYNSHFLPSGSKTYLQLLDEALRSFEHRLVTRRS